MTRISFNERLSIDYPVAAPVNDRSSVGYPKVIKDVVNGRVVQKVEFVIDDHGEEYEFNDFALENLLESGVELQKVSFNNLCLRTIDEFTERLNRLELSKSDVEPSK